MLRRRSVLALMVVGVVPAFATINSLMSSARSRRDAIAHQWARRGDAALTAGRAADAADDFRTADGYARGAYRLQLATALLAAERLTEAAAQLQTLWDETPGEGIVNLQLARIAARQQRGVDAVRYYHAAIDGSWTTADPVADRRRARLELARFLLARGDRTQAQVELVALAADPPPAAADQIAIAQLLVNAGAENRALTLLALTQRNHPEDAAAAELAGSIETALGDYRAARVALDRARRAGALDPEHAALLDTVNRVIDLDPDARGISSRERLRRIVHAFEIASAAIDRCSADTLDALRERRDRLAQEATPRALAGDPDAVDDTLAFASTAVDAVHGACGEGDRDERAVQLVFQQRRPRP